jgi:hypothetical protein
LAINLCPQGDVNTEEYIILTHKFYMHTVTKYVNYIQQQPYYFMAAVVLIFCTGKGKGKGKGKAVPLLAWSGPEGSRKLR